MATEIEQVRNELRRYKDEVQAMITRIGGEIDDLTARIEKLERAAKAKS
jgi:uncharacterized protein YqgV (UPF0045/DUF77 family)